MSEAELADDKSIDLIFRTLGSDIPACLLYPDDANIVFKIKHVSSMPVNEAWLVQAR